MTTATDAADELAAVWAALDAVDSDELAPVRDQLRRFVHGVDVDRYGLGDRSPWHSHPVARFMEATRLASRSQPVLMVYPRRTEAAELAAPQLSRRLLHLRMIDPDELADEPPAYRAAVLTATAYSAELTRAGWLRQQRDHPRASEARKLPGRLAELDEHHARAVELLAGAFDPWRATAHAAMTAALEPPVPEFPTVPATYRVGLPTQADQLVRAEPQTGA